MSHNTDAIVHELHVEFESMLSYVKDSQTATADQVERGVIPPPAELGGTPDAAVLRLRRPRRRVAASAC